MRRRAINLLYVLMAAGFSALLLSACTNDLKKIQEIANQQIKGGADTTRGVNIIFSDSAHVKAQILAPLMLDYAVSKEINEAYKLMPKGLKIIKFDKNHQEELNIVADTGYYYDQFRKMIILHQNVVITTVKGDVFKSQELVWDQAQHKIYSNKEVDFKMANGNVGHGTAMDTNESFYPFNMKNSTGLVILDSKFGQ